MRSGRHISTVPFAFFAADVNPYSRYINAKDKAKAKEHIQAVYADFLERPWGVLCALPINAQLMMIDRSTYDVDPVWARMLLEAVRRETPWLQTLDGRFSDTLEESGHLWGRYGIRTTVEFLAARNKLPVPTSWKTWDAAVNGLLKIY